MGQSGAGDPAEGRSDGPDCLERGRAHYERREWADAFQVLSRADRAARLAARRSRTAGDVGVPDRPGRRLPADPRTRPPGPPGLPTSAVAPSAVRSGSASACSSAERWAARPAGSPAPSGCWRARIECAEQGYLLAAGGGTADRRRRVGGRLRRRGAGRGYRRALRRRGPGRLRPPPAGPDTGRAGAGRGGAGATGRGHGRGRPRGSCRCS